MEFTTEKVKARMVEHFRDAAPEGAEVTESLDTMFTEVAEGIANMAQAARHIAVAGWLEKIRRRLVDDDDSIADVDLLYGLYRALTFEDIPHPYDEDAETRHDADRRGRDGA